MIIFGMPEFSREHVSSILRFYGVPRDLDNMLWNYITDDYVQRWNWLLSMIDSRTVLYT